MIRMLTSPNPQRGLHPLWHKLWRWPIGDFLFCATPMPQSQQHHQVHQGDPVNIRNSSGWWQIFFPIEWRSYIENFWLLLYKQIWEDKEAYFGMIKPINYLPPYKYRNYQNLSKLWMIKKIFFTCLFAKMRTAAPFNSSSCTMVQFHKLEFLDAIRANEN